MCRNISACANLCVLYRSYVPYFVNGDILRDCIKYSLPLVATLCSKMRASSPRLVWSWQIKGRDTNEEESIHRARGGGIPWKWKIWERRMCVAKEKGEARARESLCARERSRSNRKGDKRVKKMSTREKEQNDDTGWRRLLYSIQPLFRLGGINFQKRFARENSRKAN